MKHKIDDDVNVNVNLPTEDVERLIDKITDSALKITAAVTAAYILKSLLDKGK